MNPPSPFATVYCQEESSPGTSRILVNGFGVWWGLVHASLPSWLDS